MPIIAIMIMLNHETVCSSVRRNPDRLPLGKAAQCVFHMSDSKVLLSRIRCSFSESP